MIGHSGTGLLLARETGVVLCFVCIMILQEMCQGKFMFAGTVIMVYINGAHYNPESWPNPETYDPERFAPENVQGRSRFSYIPFSAGNR